jgi:phospholipase/carboxylesterase
MGVLARWRILGLTLTLVMFLGCAGERKEIDADQVLAFRIPLGTAEAAGDSTLCLVSVPAGYRPDRSWPVLVALHGYGSGAARFNLVWREAASAAGFVLVTPQGEDRAEGGIGWSWGPHADLTVRRSLDAVKQSINIDESRIFLAGFSQGGTLTYSLALRHPYLFSGIAPIGAGRSLPAAERLDLLRGMRIYIGHGELEPGLEDVRRLAADLGSVGAKVMFREYAGVGHGLPDPATPELVRLFKFLGSDD